MLLVALFACAVPGGIDTKSVDVVDTDADPGDPEGAACTLTGASYPDGAADPDRTWTESYDGWGHALTTDRLTQDYRYTFAWTWEGDCLLTAQFDLEAEGTLVSQTSTAYTCDSHDNLLTAAIIALAADGTDRTQEGAWEYVYDGDRMQTESYQEDGDWGPAGYLSTYTYDGEQLVQVDVDNGHSFRTMLYEYDADGLLAVERGFNDGEEWRVEYTYDEAGRVATMGTGSEADGAVDTTTTYTYEGDEPYYTDAVVSNGVTMHQDVSCE